jgi:hypothetical protein
VTVNSVTNKVNREYWKILEGKGHIAYIGFHKGIGYFLALTKEAVSEKR